MLRRNVALLLSLILGAQPLTAQSAQEIVIGEQVWMTRNLATTRFANGDSIPEIRPDSLWRANRNLRRPAWVALENNPARVATYGRLYNYFAVADPRGICPTGWRVPSNAEWHVLADRLGGFEWAGRRLKSRAWGGDLAIGFNALPGGTRYEVGPFEDRQTSNTLGYWWSSNPVPDPLAAGSVHMEARDWIIYIGQSGRGEGLSVRCMRDAPPSAVLTPVSANAAPRPVTTTMTDPRDGRVYRTIRAVGLTWMAENLAFVPKSGGVSRYRDDAAISAQQGLLYDFQTALKACPAGWRLPTYPEAQALIDSLGATAGKKLRASQGWADGAVGTDAIGFTALPAGSRYDTRTYGNLGAFSAWWIGDSRSGWGPDLYFALTVSARRDEAYTDSFDQARGLSVRCVQAP